MEQEKSSKLNSLLSDWPYGAVYTASWLNRQGIPYALTSKYRTSNWIKSVGRGAFSKLKDEVKWTGGLWAIQEQLGLPIHVGAKTALSLLGASHYLTMGEFTATLFGSPSVKLPQWFKEYNFGVKIEYITTNMFESVPEVGLTKKDVGAFSLKIASSERAIMEVLYSVPHRQSFEESFLLMEGLTSLRPNLVQNLLVNCGSVKVKRLFMYMAEKINHPWGSRLNRDLINFGSGKRLIVKGGFLDPKYQITVPVSHQDD